MSHCDCSRRHVFRLVIQTQGRRTFVWYRRSDMWPGGRLRRRSTEGRARGGGDTDGIVGSNGLFASCRREPPLRLGTLSPGRGYQQGHPIDDCDGRRRPPRSSIHVAEVNPSRLRHRTSARPACREALFNYVVYLVNGIIQ